MKRAFLVAGLALIVSFSRGALADVVPPAVELPATLTLDDALRIFRSRGLEILIAEAQVRSAEGDVRIAGAVPNPSVSLGYGRVLNYDASCDGCSANQYSLGISDSAAIEDTLSGKRHLRVKVARAALEAARMSRVDAERALVFQIKAAYAQVALAKSSLDFAKDVAASNQKTLDLNRLRYPQVIDEGALARIETQKLEADQAVDNAELALRQARVNLAFLLGVRGTVPNFDVDKDLLKYNAPATLANATPESLMKTAVDHRPDLRSQAYQKSRAEAAIALAKRQRFPDIAVSLNYTQTGTGGQAIQPPTVSVGLSAPLPLFYQQQGEIRRAEADYDAQSLQYAKLTAQVVSDVGQAYAAYATSKRLVERMETSLLERAKKARDIVEIQFKAGGATLMDYLDAQRTFISTNLEYLQDLTSYWTAVYQLEQAVGVELRK